MDTADRRERAATMGATSLTIVSAHVFGSPIVDVSRSTMYSKGVVVRIGDLSLFLENKAEARRVAESILASLRLLRDWGDDDAR